MKLESGETLGPVTLAYETYGKLNAGRTNAVLVCHALSGDAHVAGLHSTEDKRPGWWDFMIGPGRPIDTDRFFVICSNVIGGCKGSTGPLSINPKTSRVYGLDFPVITIGDMVRAQSKLIDHLGIKKSNTSCCRDAFVRLASCWTGRRGWCGCLGRRGPSAGQAPARGPSQPPGA